MQNPKNSTTANLNRARFLNPSAIVVFGLMLCVVGALSCVLEDALQNPWLLPITLVILKQGRFCSPRGHLAMSGDILDKTGEGLGKGFRWHLVGKRSYNVHDEAITGPKC